MSLVEVHDTALPVGAGALLEKPNASKTTRNAAFGALEDVVFGSVCLITFAPSTGY